MNIGARIQFYRRVRNLSQAELASRLGMAASQLSRYETGRIQPTISILSRIAKGLGVPMSELLF